MNSVIVGSCVLWCRSCIVVYLSAVKISLKHLFCKRCSLVCCVVDVIVSIGEA